MTTLDLGLAVGALGAIGLVVNRCIACFRLRRLVRRQDRMLVDSHQRCSSLSENLESWIEEIRELIPAIVDAQRRYGFPLGPRLHVMAQEVGPDASSRALLQLVPGFRALGRNGERSTWDSYAGPAEQFTGWVPPAAVVEPPPKARRRPRLALPQATGARGD
jgi:hypothetical protein